MSDAFTTDRPTESGWYDVILELGESASRLYVTVTPDLILWGWHEKDDPEAITLAGSGPFQYRKAAPPDDLEFRLQCV